MQMGSVRPFGDIAGQRMVHLRDARRQPLGTRPEAAIGGMLGYLSGTDWHEAGIVPLRVRRACRTLTITIWGIGQEACQGGARGGRHAVRCGA